MKRNISERIIKPENCAVAFGIPTSKQAFERDGSDEVANKEFAKLYRWAWGKFEAEIVNPFEKVVPVITGLGVEVCAEATLEDFGQLVRNERFDVVVLFSHWGDESIEFHDGFAQVPSIIEKIPSDFDRILDLSVCHPKSLVEALRRERPDCLIRHIELEKEVTPGIWMYFYLALFKHLKHSDVTYLKALLDVIEAFLKIKRGSKP